MSACTVLRCDACSESYLDVAEARWLAHIHAREDGWVCDQNGDFCPDCVAGGDL